MTRYKWFQRPDQPVDYVAGEPALSKYGRERRDGLVGAAVPTPEPPLMTKAGLWRSRNATTRLNQR
ncbi:hypothetical protein HCB18_26625 [Salinispora arenicola]|nr:hypothetical protein [Salinispora arenicola]